jgi:hypothetical protein
MDNVLTDCERLALMVGCLCHDLDHRGVNNQFLNRFVAMVCYIHMKQ